MANLCKCYGNIIKIDKLLARFYAHKEKGQKISFHPSVRNFYLNQKFKLFLLLLNREQTIKARVTIKSDKHSFYSRLGPGIMFTVDLVDPSGEIRPHIGHALKNFLIRLR